MAETKLTYSWGARDAASFQTGVSIHSHTSHSRESLEFIPQYARRSAVLAKVMDLAEWQYNQRTGQSLDFGRAFWTPPLSPRMALDLESRQIGNKLGLPALVSLTDHDCIQAGLDVDGPVSCEWTVPYERSFFHLGIHNLPPARAREIHRQMQAFTADPEEGGIAGLLELLDGDPEILIVLNHPLWDEGLIGQKNQDAMFEHFLTEYGRWIHALELNGLRSAEENAAVVAAARRWNLPAISGGDRHGREPNANVNLTNAASFPEFVEEIRRGGVSHVLFLPQYSEPLRLRQFETAWDILRFEPEHSEGRERWLDRVFYIDHHDEITRSIAHYFGGRGPALLVPFLAVMRLLESPRLRPALRVALAD